jgi:fumarate hydratase subunit alpha
MKTIHTDRIVSAVAALCVRANLFLGEDIKKAFLAARAGETTPLAQAVLDQLTENATTAAERALPICQDTGMAVVFVELGQEVCVIGGLLSDAINAGVAKGYREGCLRKSVVRDPVDRVNTNDNTPAVIHYDIVGGDQLKIIVAPKGFGSENMSALGMLKPSDGIAGVKDFVLETVRRAGANPCPPMIVGVGVGGTTEKACLIAKKALLRPVGSANETIFWAEAETELLAGINRLNIGPAGFGGKTTALAVHINPFPTHIAGLPVAVNIGCHVTRHAETVL